MRPQISRDERSPWRLSKVKVDAAGTETLKATSQDLGGGGERSFGSQEPDHRARAPWRLRGKTAQGLDRHFRGGGGERRGRWWLRARGQRGSRGGASGGSQGLGDEEVGLSGHHGQERAGEKAGKGCGEPRGPPTPHIPPRRPASRSGRGRCVRSGRTCVRGAAGGTWRRAPRLQESEGPRAPPGAVRRLTRGLSCRRPPGPACAPPRLSGRGPVWRCRGEDRRAGRGKASGRRARLPLPVSGPHCRG